MRALRIALLIALASGATGCVLPPALTIASFAADGLSLATSGKTITDHAISLLAHRDCRLWRLIEGKSICGADASVVAVAKLPPPLPIRAASPAFNPTAPIVAAATPVEAPVSEPVASSSAAAPTSPSAEPALHENAIPTTAPAPTSSPVAANGSTTASPRQKTAPASAMPTHQASHSAVPAPVAALPVRHGTSDAGVRGEMVIRSGTDEAEARALGEALHAAGAIVRPIQHGDITVYEVVMGLSG
ncbi:MAG TPA: hypothetical protein VJN67_07755 [Stellaceae bacterium]|nr:hypothetical protein [Stellaceae bacterium]